VLGNLIENAARHAASRVRIATRSGNTSPEIIIEDDGKGIAPAELASALERGVRLDERSEGAGLGLAIVQDVLEAYNWRLELDKSKLGGLKATVSARANELVPREMALTGEQS